ncbi:Pleckstrin homology-like domain [Phytophthora cinnamomi]|uniref:Pleckstrin homology-like domain n=1 Tax=Phytophthora cinnamomi TaxID=4785 RepID=UPI00355A7302|nr:Pleckstrin homology-like domain [Phytophthora cinnamomi]
MGSHWLVYANQSQAISSGEAPTPVAVYELVGITVAEGEDETSANEFSIHVVPGKHVKCRARSSLERKRWMNAVEDEILTQAKTSETLERSMKEREEKLAAREAVKSKMHEVKTDARRLSELLGEAIKKAREDSDTDSDSDAHGNSSGRIRHCVSDRTGLHRRQSGEFTDATKRGESAFAFDTLDTVKSSDANKNEPASAFMSFFACFFRCVPLNSTGSAGRNVIAPLGIPGYPSTAAACSAVHVRLLRRRRLPRSRQLVNRKPLHEQEKKN